MEPTTGPPATRLIFTNLPPSLTVAHLRAHLQRCPPFPPTLTDLKVLLKPDGTSRRLAFAGFRDSKEAKRVLEWVKGSWVQGAVGGTRIEADWAKETRDAPRPRKRAKLSPPPASATDGDATPTLAAQPATSTAPPSKGAKDEAARFAEFMSVMGPRKGRALEEASEPAMLLPTPQPVPAPVVALEQPKKQQQAVAVQKPEVEQEEVVVPKDKIVDDEGISDMEYMTRRMKRKLEVEEDVEQEEADEAPESGAAKEWVQDEDVPAKAAAPVEDDPLDPLTGDPKALLLDSPRLFVRNLAFHITEPDLRELFSSFGDIESIHIPLDAITRSSKGLAYISFVSPDAALAAYEQLDRSSFQGRLLHILPAVSRNPAAKGEPKAATGVRGDREHLKKMDAGKALNWGTLYMNSDAVMSSIADRLKIPKSQLLDSESDNAAVRVALAETHVIAETKQYFENEGINLAAFTTPGPRSSTAILVKNIPYNTTQATLSTLFAPFGTIARLLLPPAGTMAIVEMIDAASASAAWRGLVYKKLGASILYLEKAPASLWHGGAPPPPSDSTSSASLTPATSTSLPTSASSKPDDSEPGATLFIKNLSFATTSASLTGAFAALGGFVSARIQTKPDPKRAGQTLSMGFGFVAFKTVGSATQARKLRDGFRLDGHKLEVKFAHRGKEDSEEGKEDKKKTKAGGGNSTKLIVKNVPFEVTKKDLRELFSAYGQLNSVRLPRKLDNKTRGFAFLDFASRRDAEAAFGALEHTHILGRHLVLQWADEGDDEVEKLREKAKEFSKGGVGGRKSKFKLGDEGGGSSGGGGGDDAE
ncbi:hypothetical protein RQP46_011309 [Phenoliferia psychrophenolica]